MFPDELYQAPRSWAERAYPDNLLYFNEGQRRPLRGLGAAATILGGDARELQNAAQVVATAR